MKIQVQVEIDGKVEKIEISNKELSKFVCKKAREKNLKAKKIHRYGVGINVL